MVDSRVPLKNPILAGILAFLIPGAGHFYQGRMFKAVVFSVCILGLFFTGMAVAGWKAVQAPPKQEGRNVVRVLKYAAQSAVGLPALYALVQRERYYSEQNQPVDVLAEPLTAPFTGQVECRTDEGLVAGPVTGTLYLEPTQGEFGTESIAGRFEGSLEGEPIELTLASHTELAKPVQANERRGVLAGLVVQKEGRQEAVGQLVGSIPRPFTDWFQVPMDDLEEQQLHRELGKYHELAMVFTWIAGLLNVMVIWDAVQGPAYGYGDEPEATEEPNATA